MTDSPYKEVGVAFQLRVRLYLMREFARLFVVDFELHRRELNSVILKRCWHSKRYQKVSHFEETACSSPLTNKRGHKHFNIDFIQTTFKIATLGGWCIILCIFHLIQRE